MPDLTPSFMPNIGQDFLTPTTNTGINSELIKNIQNSADYAYHFVAQKKGINPDKIASLGGACFEASDAMAASMEVKGIDAWTRTFHGTWVDHEVVVFIDGNDLKLADLTWKQFPNGAPQNAPNILVGTPGEMVELGRFYKLAAPIINFYASAA
jgi:hypothetical protein